MLLILTFSIVAFLGYLIVERIILERRLNSIPVRICVTGTRGKSTLVRMLTAVLREEGKKTLGKITGSKAAFILPNGEETTVRRRGLTSIMEQKKLVKKAAELEVNYLIAEIMSIHPENHFIEAQRLLKPHILIITNVRRDHTDAMGKTGGEIAAVLSSCITPKAKVFIQEKENNPVFEAAAKKSGAELTCVNEEPPAGITPAIKKNFFPGGLSLINALCSHLHIKQSTIIKGLEKVKHDITGFKVWQYRPERTQAAFFPVNAFAANDPQSTFEILVKLKEILPVSTGKPVGLLNLRADRGDRTIQWIEALQNGGGDFFERIYVTGAHTRIVKRKLKNIVILKHKQPEKIMQEIIRDSGSQAAAKAGATNSHPQTGKGQVAPAAGSAGFRPGTGTGDKIVIFGFGNIKGAGNLLIDYWNKIGEEYV